MHRGQVEGDLALVSLLKIEHLVLDLIEVEKGFFAVVLLYGLSRRRVFDLVVAHEAGIVQHRVHSLATMAAKAVVVVLNVLIYAVFTTVIAGRYFVLLFGFWHKKASHKGDSLEDRTQ